MAQPALPPALLSALKEALGCMVIGTVLSACVYGVSVLQAYLYFRKSSHDSTGMKYFVAFLFALDTISMVLTVITLYDYVVTDFGNPFSLLTMPPIITILNAITSLIAMLTQCFFAHRIWRLSKGNLLLVSSIVIVALCGFGPSIAISVHLYLDRELSAIASLEVRILSGVGTGLSVMCDIIIVIALCYYLNSKRTGFKRTDSIIDRLIIYAINRGFLTAVCQAGHMISTVSFPGHFVFFVFGLLEAKLYCNTLFATLNAQKSLREDGNNVMELGTQIINRINAPTALNDVHCRTMTGQSAGTFGSSQTFVLPILDISSANKVELARIPAVGGSP